MCAPALSLPRIAHQVSDNSRHIQRIIIVGSGVALVSLVAFGVFHALIILPIWTRLLAGAPFTLGAGIALAWAFEDLNRARGWQSARDGARFGAVMFVTLLPATAFDTTLRLIGAEHQAEPG